MELTFQFSDKRLTVRICDNGCGIDPRVLKKGRDGHWGLATTRERASKFLGTSDSSLTDRFSSTPALPPVPSISKVPRYGLMAPLPAASP